MAQRTTKKKVVRVVFNTTMTNEKIESSKEVYICFGHPLDVPHYKLRNIQVQDVDVVKIKSTPKKTALKKKSKTKKK